MTALHYAAARGHLPAVRALIHAGAPLDIQATDGFRWPFCAAGRRGAESARVSAGQCRRRCRRSSAGTRRCTSLPTTATPTQRPRCSAPARTRSSRMATGTLCRATRADRHRPPAAGVRRDTAEKLGQSHRESGAYAAAVAQALTFVPSFTTFSRRHCAPRPRRCSCALAPARPSVERDAPDLPLLSAHSFACAAVPLRHARRGRTNTSRGHAHGTTDALRMRLPAHSAGPHAWRCRPNLSRRRRRRCVPSRCASGWAVAPASAHGSTNCERTARRAGAFLGSFCIRKQF
jgi:hypothetical protein